MTDDITQPPPPEVAAELSQVSSALDRVVPVKQSDRNLLIGAFENIARCTTASSQSSAVAAPAGFI